MLLRALGAGLPDCDSFSNLVLASNRESMVKTAIGIIDQLLSPLGV